MAGRAKGTTVLATVRFLKEKFGQGGLEKIVARLGPEDRQRMETPVLPSAWYPLSLLLGLMRGAKAEFGSQMPDLYRQIGKASADYSLSAAYSVVFKVSSTQWIISRAATVFATYYDSGKMAVPENGKGMAVIELTDFAEPAPEFCERIAGWCVRILEHCGEKGVKVEHVKCRCRGDRTCQFKATWA
jgi:hypothetical protein